MNPRRTYPHAGSAFAAPTAAPQPASVTEPSAGTPAYIQQAYDLSYLSQTAGASQTVALVDAYDDPSAEADLATYRTEFNLPACTTANGCFKKADQTGGSTYPTADSEWALEISLDLDTVSAACPNCHILLVEANTNSFDDLQAAQSEAAALGATQISDSWGASEPVVQSGTFTFPDIATVASTGDNGYTGSGWDQYPAALPGVNAAGGTTLSPSASARGFTESAWSGAGSGCDLQEAKPAWQTTTGCDGRASADISADASPYTGLQIFDSGRGGWIQVGGTSLASPLIASYYALTGANAASPAWAYTNAALLNDPVSGTNDNSNSNSNGTCAAAIAYICAAGPGYDGPTGAGSISGQVATGAPGVGGPGASGDYMQTLGAYSAALSAGAYPNGLDTTVYFQYGTTNSYGAQTATVNLGSGVASAQFAATLPSLQASTTYHYRMVASNADGTIYGYDVSATTLPTPNGPLGGPPTVSSAIGTATGVTTAAFSGVVDGMGSDANAYFQYGTTSAYGATTTPVTLLSGNYTSTINPPGIVGLQAGTTYHYALTVTSSAGTTTSPDQTFTTTSAPPGVNAPTVTITAAPPASTASTYAVVMFTIGGEVTSSFATLDGYDLDPSSGSFVISGLSVGIHTIQITVSGPGGSGTATVTWTVTSTGTPPPGPTVTITSQPPATSTATSGSINYTTTGATMVTCVVDSINYPCTDSTLSLSNMSVGDHVAFIIVDGQGGSVTRDAVWTVTAPVGAPPTLVITAPSNSTATSMTVNYVTTGATSATCSLDTVNVTCSTTSAALSGLSVGSHTLAVTVYGPGGTASDSVQWDTDAPAPPTASTSTATAITSVAATLNGTLIANGADASYYYQYGTTTSYGQSTSIIDSGSSGTSSTPAPANVTGLSATSTYHFQLVVQNANGTAYGADQTLVTLVAPTAVSAAASAVNAGSATLNGTANPQADPAATAYFQYGPDANYGQSTTPVALGMGTSDEPQTAALSGLSASSTYHYRLVVQSSAGAVYGSDMSFSTSDMPVALTTALGTLDPTDATVNGTVNPGGADTTYHFEYGTSIAYGSSTGALDAGAGTSGVPVTALLTGLNASTAYHYRLVATNLNGTTDSSDATLTTPASGLPVPNTGTATSVTARTATLGGSFVADGADTSYYFQYGGSVLYGQSTALTDSGQSGFGSTPATASISGLTPSSGYHFRLVTVNADGTSYGNDQTFTTLALPLITTGTPTNITQSGAQLNGTVNPENSHTTAEFEWGTDTGYGNSTASTDLGAGSEGISTSASLTGLQPGTTYHVQVVAVSSAGETDGGDVTFTTNQAAPTVHITAAPANSTATTATINYNETGPVTGTICKLDTVALPCSDSEADLSGMSVGAHELIVTATGPGGTASDSVQWDTDAPAPPTPRVSITQEPSSSTSTSATIRFTDSGSIISIMCQLDSQAAAPCSTDSVSYSGLSLGWHTFTVTVMGMDGAPVVASATWDVLAPTPPPTTPQFAWSKLHLSATTIAHCAAHTSCKTKYVKLSFVLNRPAELTITLKRKVGKKTRVVAHVTVREASGAHSYTLKRKFGGHTLAPGLYQLSATATAAKAHTTTFYATIQVR